MWFWRKQPILRGYVSEVDGLLQDFERNYPKQASSASRRAEEKTFERIGALMDRAQAANDESAQIWKDAH